MVKYKKTKKQLEVFAFEHRMLGKLVCWWKEYQVEKQSYLTLIR